MAVTVSLAPAPIGPWSNPVKPCSTLPAPVLWGVAISAPRCGSFLSERSTDIPDTGPINSPAAELIEAVGLRNACELDLLLFFSQHPRVVLRSEQLATYVGYELPQVAHALERLLGAGFLKRTVNQDAPGRMYFVEVDHVEAWLEPLRRVCAAPAGRTALRVLLKQRQSQSGERPSRRLFRVRPS